MAHIIDLACDIIEIRSRYLKIHDAVFGLSLRRSASWLQRGRSKFYADRELELGALADQLANLESAIAGGEGVELTRRARRQLHEALVQYTKRLVITVGHLKVICGNLRFDEADYRRSAADGDSPFRRDKITYDYSMQELKRWGAKMNDLFSTF